jgi:hypothetical protein
MWKSKNRVCLKSQTFLSLENFDNDDDISSASENIRQNMKPSASDS